MGFPYLRAAWACYFFLARKKVAKKSVGATAPNPNRTGLAREMRGSVLTLAEASGIFMRRVPRLLCQYSFV